VEEEERRPEEVLDELEVEDPPLVEVEDEETPGHCAEDPKTYPEHVEPSRGPERVPSTHSLVPVQKPQKESVTQLAQVVNRKQSTAKQLV